MKTSISKYIFDQSTGNQTMDFALSSFSFDDMKELYEMQSLLVLQVVWLMAVFLFIIDAFVYSFSGKFISIIANTQLNLDKAWGLVVLKVLAPACLNILAYNLDGQETSSALDALKFMLLFVKVGILIFILLVNNHSLLVSFQEIDYQDDDDDDDIIDDDESTISTIDESDNNAALSRICSLLVVIGHKIITAYLFEDQCTGNETMDLALSSFSFDDMEELSEMLQSSVLQALWLMTVFLFIIDTFFYSFSAKFISIIEDTTLNLDRVWNLVKCSTSVCMNTIWACNLDGQEISSTLNTLDSLLLFVKVDIFIFVSLVKSHSLIVTNSSPPHQMDDCQDDDDDIGSLILVSDDDESTIATIDTSGTTIGNVVNQKREIIQVFTEAVVPQKAAYKSCVIDDIPSILQIWYTPIMKVTCSNGYVGLKLNVIDHIDTRRLLSLVFISPKLVKKDQGPILLLKASAAQVDTSTPLPVEEADLLGNTNDYDANDEHILLVDDTATEVEKEESVDDTGGVNDEQESCNDMKKLQFVLRRSPRIMELNKSKEKPVEQPSPQPADDMKKLQLVLRRSPRIMELNKSKEKVEEQPSPQPADENKKKKPASKPKNKPKNKPKDKPKNKPKDKPKDKPKKLKKKTLPTRWSERLKHCPKKNCRE